MHRIEKTVSSREETELPGDRGWVRLIYLGIYHFVFFVFGAVYRYYLSKKPKN